MVVILDEGKCCSKEDPGETSQEQTKAQHLKDLYSDNYNIPYKFTVECVST